MTEKTLDRLFFWLALAASVGILLSWAFGS